MRLRLFLLLGILMAFTSSVLWCTTTVHSTFQSRYGWTPGCTYCHSVTPPCRNGNHEDFACALKAQHDGGASWSQALQALEDEDTDGDTADNLVEFQRHTRPGIWSEHPLLRISPSTIRLVTDGLSEADIELWNDGLALDYQAETLPSWATLSPSSGLTTGGGSASPSTLRLSIDGRALGSGEHEEPIVFSTILGDAEALLSVEILLSSQQETVLLDAHVTESFDHFGRSVAAVVGPDGRRWAVAGDPGHPAYPGLSYRNGATLVFESTTRGQWSQPSGWAAHSSNDRLGSAVAAVELASGGVAAVSGAFGGDSDYLFFHRFAGVDQIDNDEDTLEVFDPPGCLFECYSENLLPALALGRRSDDTVVAVIGAPGLPRSPGQARVLQARCGPGQSCQLGDDDTLSLYYYQDNVGLDVDTDGNHIVVAGVDDDHPGLDTGSAGYFLVSIVEWDAANADWTVLTSTWNYGLTTSVAVDAGVVAVANGWNVRTLTVTGEGLGLVYPSGSEEGDMLGADIALDYPYLVVGSPGRDDVSEDGGIVHVFRGRQASYWHEWVEVAQLRPPDRQTGKGYGSSVDISGDLIVVGMAPDEATVSNPEARVYVYHVPDVAPSLFEDDFEAGLSRWSEIP